MTRGWDGAVAVEECSGYWGIKTYPGHFYLGQWPVLRVDRRALHGVQSGVKTVDHLGTAAAACEYYANPLKGGSMQGDKEGRRGRESDLSKDCVFAVEMRLLGVGDEELGFVRVRAGVGHGEDPAVVELREKNR